MRDTRTIRMECGRGSFSDFLTAKKDSNPMPGADGRPTTWFELVRESSGTGFAFSFTVSKIEEQPVRRRR